MKNRFRLLLIAAFSFAFVGVNAQSFILKAGANFSNMLEKDDVATFSDDYESIIGLHVEASAELPLVSVLYLEPGVRFSMKGFKIDAEEMGSLTSRINYLDIPLNLKARMDLGVIGLWGSVGPYLGIGVGGKNKAENIPLLGDFEKKIEFGKDKDLKLFDYGLGLGLGAEFHGILLGAYYNLGMANIANKEGNGYTSQNRVISVSLGYRFAR
ncbi:MAG: hypothetical protein CSA95_01920 [Bacteroidetes bacterium]|nr:MAG: hypothetical protein CSA95_01920 [Bacteroidota bacterium]